MGVFHLRWAFVLGAGAINGEEKKWAVKTPPVAPKPPPSPLLAHLAEICPLVKIQRKRLADDDLMPCTGGLIEFPKLFDSL